MGSADRLSRSAAADGAAANGADPRASARAAGLCYVDDSRPGIRRRRCGRGWSYRHDDGRPLGDRRERRRIEALAIPPAWTEVWICADPRGHLQATGRDARGRKQYRYHPRFAAERGRTKFERTRELGAALPRLRRRVRRDLERPGLPRERVVAAVVRLLDATLVRVGNDEYARDNDSYGLTTLRRRHARVNGSEIRLEFRSKSGRRHAVALDDPRAARVVRRCRELGGQELFTWLGEGGERCDVGSGDVNDYLREATGLEVSAKDFRTWAGTVVAAAELARLAPPASEAEAKRAVAAAVRAVAERLGNRAATARKYYVHPAVVASYADGTLAELAAAPRPAEPRGLAADERLALALLERGPGDR